LRLFRKKNKPICNHELVITDEYIASDSMGGHIDTWWERKLKCTLCNEEFVDRKIGVWKYKAKRLDYLQ